MATMESMVFVRDAQHIDAQIVLRHEQLSVQESAAYRGSIQLQQVTASRTWVAGWGTTIFGSLTVGETTPRCWHITCVFVEQQAREMGIGDALVQHALSQIAQVNGSWVGAQAQPGDRSLKNLFERHGLVAQTITVGKSLIDPSTEEHASQ
jgi:ribosomal protein S18 acetylase RimI-like enzyme